LAAAARSKVSAMSWMLDSTVGFGPGEMRVVAMRARRAGSGAASNSRGCFHTTDPFAVQRSISSTRAEAVPSGALRVRNAIRQPSAAPLTPSA